MTQKKTPPNADTPQKGKGGAPSKYEEVAPLIIEYYRGGLTLMDSARRSGISYSTLHTWRKNIPAFAEALEEARSDYLAMVQEEVELSLYQRAKGMVIYSIREEADVLPDGTEIITKRIRTAKKIAPDPAAANAILSTIDPDKWATKLSEAMYTADGKPITIDLTPPLHNANDTQTKAKD